MIFPWTSWWKCCAVNTVLATVATHFNSISIGFCQGYSAILLPQISESSSHIYFMDEDVQFTVNSEEGSWIASIGVLSNPIGALLAGIMMDVCGRKSSIMFTTIPFVFGWSVIALSSDVYTLCIGRCITGLAVGMGSSCYMYVAEISLPSSRGFLSSLGPVFVSFGVLSVYFLGYVTTWKTIAVVCAVFALISAAVICYIPDSPCWLAAKGRIDEATEALDWLHGTNSSAADREIADILESVKISHKTNRVQTVKQFLRKCVQPEVWKPFLILVTFFILQELTGMYAVLYYAVDFFRKTGTSLNDYVASILVGVLRFLFSIIGSFCIQRFPRKRLASLSGLLMAAAMAFGAFYESKYGIIDTAYRPYSWIPLACILLNVSASTLGMLQIPWLMIGELFPLSVRGIMGGLVCSLAYLFIFATVKFYPNAERVLNTAGIMMLFSIASLLAGLYALTLLPETKDKSLNEIEQTFVKKKYNNASSTEKLQDSFSPTPHPATAVQTTTTMPNIAIITDDKKI